MTKEKSYSCGQPSALGERKRIVDKKVLLPFVLVTSLFFWWGLANNMTDTLLAAFRNIMDMSDTQTSFIQMAFYGAYFCVALPAAMLIKRYSFKCGVLTGLGLYALGALLFLPAAKAASYAFYLVAIYIMASGCSVLETTANPYIMSMGSPETATRRLNIAQSFNPMGSIAGILMSKHFILDDLSLYSVSGTYAFLGVVLLAIMVAMVFSRMPQGSDTDGGRNGILSVFRRLFSNKKFAYGVVAQFFYIGAQICVWSFTIRIVMQELGLKEAAASTYFLYSMVGFCLSRFVYTWLMKYFSPVKLLAFSGVTSMVCAVCVAVGEGTGLFLVISLICVSLFMSMMFPTIYAVALESVLKTDTPDDSKIGASVLIMSILGGALITPVMGMVSDSFGIYAGYFVPCACFAVVLAYAFYCLKSKNA